jgi:hypothetical protein
LTKIPADRNADQCEDNDQSDQSDHSHLSDRNDQRNGSNHKGQNDESNHNHRNDQNDFRSYRGVKGCDSERGGGKHHFPLEEILYLSQVRAGGKVDLTPSLNALSNALPFEDALDPVINARK